MEEFSVATGIRDGCQIIVVSGELDEATAPTLDDAIAACREEWPVIIDLTAVEFISSAGIHALLRERATRTALVCPPGNVARLFEIVQAQRRVPVFENLDSAIENLTPRQDA